MTATGFWDNPEYKQRIKKETMILTISIIAGILFGLMVYLFLKLSIPS